MQTSEMILAVFLTAVAVSYGWGMRGAIIGGEKGAMLPGALLGLFLARLSGIPLISENWFVFSAAGCLAMGYGGFEPYAQTMAKILHHNSDEYNPKHGYLGLMLKGANWFGICGAILGMSFMAMSGTFYEWYEIAIIILLIPLIQLLGIKIFNKPYDKENGIFPKVYFSFTSREEWGGNLLTLLLILSATAFKGDRYSFLFGIVGIISGALGWVISIWLYDITVHPLKNGKYIFGKLQTGGFIDNWKIMEFSLGLLGAGGLAVYFFARREYLYTLYLFVLKDDIFSAFNKNESIVAWVCFFLAISVIVQYFFKKLNGSRVMELIERAVYFSLILCVVLLGNKTMASLVVFLLILWVVVEKNIFDRLENTKTEKIFKALFAVIFVIALILQIIVKGRYTINATILMYTFFYILAEIIFVALRPLWGKEKKQGDKFRGCILTYLWFTVLSTALMIVSVKIL